jgi:hypothetical protein
VYRKVELSERDAGLTVDLLRQLGLQPRDDGEGKLCFDEDGFALYAPAGVVEGVTVFRRDYDTGTQSRA